MRASRFALIAVLIQNAVAQPPAVTRVEPPHWWVGMKQGTLQLMLYGQHLSDLSATVTSSTVHVKKVYHIENPAYAFLDVAISPAAKPGRCTLILKNTSGATSLSYDLLGRENPKGRYQGFDGRDVIYLITPDRFANGDTTNDSMPGMIDAVNRAEPYGRHGGDMQGIINHLDYMHDLGVTALWMNPMVEDNASTASYHGYAVTDLYRIDPRFGTNELYKVLVREGHRRGLKIIMDHVNNHIGINHPWIKNLPTPDWLNGTVENHQKAFHSKIELPDIHSDSLTKSKATLGWFTDYMPDLNQTNPFVANYLIQNTIWWIESTGLDGIREDTYPYVNRQFASRWCEAIMREYPKFNIVGEAWVEQPPYLAPYQAQSFLTKHFDSHLPSLMDFALFRAFHQVFAESTSIGVIHECLTQDFLYADPLHLVTFFDNHDITRLMYRVNSDIQRVKLALALLLTTRGIPQILYGTEIGMMGGKDHGRLRADFPGGFPGDAHNAFIREGRTTQEDDVFTFMKNLLTLRKQHPALALGTLIHFKPVKEVYTYFRIRGRERIMIIINNNRDRQRVDLTPFQHQFLGKRKLLDLRSGRAFDLVPDMSIEVDGNTSAIFLLSGG